MSSTVIARYVTPWKFRREREHQQRIEELRARDGDNCLRCRRAIRFDLTPGHDAGPKIEPLFSGPVEDAPIENLCLCHGRCNADAGDNTVEVTERVRRKAEAELFAKSPRKRLRKAG